MARPLTKKVLLIGWDAADWKVINPLLDAGLMPALSQLIDGGVMGNIATLQPSLSPILWTSIATGKLPQKHGIHGFVEPLPDGSGIRPVTSTSRKGKAIWNILSQSNLRSNVIGWFASHPAEPIKGVSVTNQFYSNPPAQGAWSVPPQSIHPMARAETLAEFRVHPSEIVGDHIQPLIPDAAKIDQSKPENQKRLTAIQKYLAECASVHGAATWLMENEPWDFTAIYYGAIDLLSHYFMPFHPPRLPEINEQDFEIYKNVVTGIYRFHDMMLRRLLQLAGEDCTIILLSDHGFHSDHLRPQSEREAIFPAAWHRSHGIICLNGPEILRDERIYGSSLLDIAPTILTLFGLPIGEDMDGKALIQAFKTAPSLEAIPSWENVPGECGLHPADLQQDPVAAQQALQQLVDLGYIQAAGQDAQKSIRGALDDWQINRATSLFHYDDPSAAAEIFEKLFTSWPEEKSFGIALMQAWFKAGELKDARSLLEKLREKFPNTASVELMTGSLLLAENQIDAALVALRKAEELSPNLPQLHIRLGSAYLRSRRWIDAGRAFRQALEIDGDNAEASHGLSAALLRQNKLDEALEMALRAVGLQHFFPAAHFQLGMVLARLNQPERAALAFEHGLAMNPGVIVAHRYLARLYYRLGDFRKCHEHHQAVVDDKHSADGVPLAS